MIGDFPEPISRACFGPLGRFTQIQAQSMSFSPSKSKPPFGGRGSPCNHAAKPMSWTIDFTNVRTNCPALILPISLFPALMTQPRRGEAKLFLTIRLMNNASRIQCFRGLFAQLLRNDDQFGFSAKPRK